MSSAGALGKDQPSPIEDMEVIEEKVVAVSENQLLPMSEVFP